MDLRLVKMYLEAAKAKVEVCHEPIKPIGFGDKSQ